MQINRLNHLIFPGNAATPPVDAQAADADAASGTSARATGAAPVAPRKPVPKEVPTLEVEKPAPASVKLTLTGSPPAAPTTYGRNGALTTTSTNTTTAPTPPTPLRMPQTPAEQFVASAVTILRNLDQDKAAVLGQDAAAFTPKADSRLTAAFGGLRQAVARLNVFA